MNKNKRIYPRVAIACGIASMKAAYTESMWHPSDIGTMYEKQPIDEWEVSNVYPFSITQHYEEVYTAEYQAQLDAMTDQQKQIMDMNIKMTMNSMYGYGSGISTNYYSSKNIYYSKSGGVGINHPGVSTNLCKELTIREFKFEGRAECHQKQLLIDHFTHKIKKTSKKKKTEISNLKKIIEIHQAYIDDYMDEFPERFI